MTRVLLSLAIPLTCSTIAQSGPPMPPAPTPRPALAWDASPSTNVVAYHVYWGPRSGVYTNKVRVDGLQVAAKRTIGTNYLAATAVDGDGVESDFSNEIAADLVPYVWVQPYTVVSLVIEETADMQTWSSLQPSLVLTNPPGAKFWRLRIVRE